MWTTARRSRFGPEDGDGRRASPTTWTVPMKRAMLEALVAGAREGKRDGNGFKKEVFKSAVDEVNKLYCSVSPGGSEKIPLAVGRIKYKIKVRKYKTFMMLRNGREFGWDEVTKVPNAPDDI